MLWTAPLGRLGGIMVVETSLFADELLDGADVVAVPKEMIARECLRE